MPRLTVTIKDEHAEFLEKKSGDDGEYESKSEVVRECIQRYERIEELETEVERLRREKRQILDQREENKQLTEYVDEERSYRRASLKKRLKWKIFGMPEDPRSGD